MPSTITLPKTEYKRLRLIAKRYEAVRHLISEDTMQSQSAEKVIQELRATKLYREPFLKTLGKSLKEAKEGHVYPLESLRALRKA